MVVLVKSATTQQKRFASYESKFAWNSHALKLMRMHHSNDPTHVQGYIDRHRSTAYTRYSRGVFVPRPKPYCRCGTGVNDPRRFHRIDLHQP